MDLCKNRQITILARQLALILIEVNHLRGLLLDQINLTIKTLMMLYTLKIVTGIVFALSRD